MNTGAWALRMAPWLSNNKKSIHSGSLITRSSAGISASRSSWSTASAVRASTDAGDCGVPSVVGADVALSSEIPAADSVGTAATSPSGVSRRRLSVQSSAVFGVMTAWIRSGRDFSSAWILSISAWLDTFIRSDTVEPSSMVKSTRTA